MKNINYYDVTLRSLVENNSYFKGMYCFLFRV